MKTSKDFLDAIGHNAGQCVHELTEMAVDLRAIESLVADLRKRAENFSPAPERQGLRIKENVGDPRDELASVRARLRYTLADIDRSSALLEERRAVLTELIG